LKCESKQSFKTNFPTNRISEPQTTKYVLTIFFALKVKCIAKRITQYSVSQYYTAQHHSCSAYILIVRIIRMSSLNLDLPLISC